MPFARSTIRWRSSCGRGEPPNKALINAWLDGVFEGLQPDRNVIGAAGGERARLERGSMGQHDHQPAPVEPVGEQAKHVERGRIRPVQVLDNEKNGGTRQSALEECAHREVDLAPELFGLDLALPDLNRAKPEDMVERRHELGTLRRRQPELGDACR